MQQIVKYFPCAPPPGHAQPCLRCMVTMHWPAKLSVHHQLQPPEQGQKMGKNTSSKSVSHGAKGTANHRGKYQAEEGQK